MIANDSQTSSNIWPYNLISSRIRSIVWEAAAELPFSRITKVLMSHHVSAPHRSRTVIEHHTPQGENSNIQYPACILALKGDRRRKPSGERDRVQGWKGKYKERTLSLKWKSVLSKQKITFQICRCNNQVNEVIPPLHQGRLWFSGC